MHPQLESIVSQLQAARERLHRLADALPEARWAQRSRPESWSAAECVAHLNLTSEAYVPLVRSALEAARAVPGAVPARYRRDPVGWLLFHAVGPMLRVGARRLGRTRTPPAFVPHGELDRARLLAGFDRLQEEQIELARGADGLPLHRVRVVSPFDARVRYNLYSCLALLPRHQARHLEQAEEVWPDARATG